MEVNVYLLMYLDMKETHYTYIHNEQYNKGYKMQRKTQKKMN